jgi:hypothetical protein
LQNCHAGHDLPAVKSHRPVRWRAAQFLAYRLEENIVILQTLTAPRRQGAFYQSTNSQNTARQRAHFSQCPVECTG